MMMMDILRLKKEAGTGMLYIQLHIMQRRRALSGSSPQNVSLKKFLVFYQKNVFLIFQEIRLSGPTLKKVLIISQKKLFLYCKKWNFLKKCLLFQEKAI